MKTKYYFEFNLKTRLQLKKWCYKKSPYPFIDILNHIYGFYIKEIDNEKFELHGLTFNLNNLSK